MNLFVRVSICFLIVISASCSFKKKNAWSILVIGVENLGFEDLSCNIVMDSNLVGFKQLCEDSVYFTHAYVPSTYSAANVASIFTGQYSFEHKLSTASSFLSEGVNTAPELLVSNNYKTSFFSSGGSMFRKKGIDQGFEVFDDKIKVASNKIYRNADQINNLFKNWYNKQDDEKTFSFLYYSDPLYKNFKTTNNDNVERSLTRSSQVEELSESVAGIISYLKSKNKWDSTMVIFTGLNGISNKENVAKFENLFSQNTHIPLLIKPPKKNRDLGISWTIDKNVSLVDIGILLRKYFKLSLNPSFALNHGVDLIKSLNGPVSDWNSERPILSESNWIDKSGEIITKYSVRFGSILYFHKNEPVLYNSLIDRQEINSLGSNSYQFKKIEKKISSLGLPKRSVWPTNDLDKMLSDFVYQFWHDKTEIELWPIEFLIEESTKNDDFYEYLVSWLLSNKKWNQIHKLQAHRADGDLQFILSKYIDNYEIKTKEVSAFLPFLKIKKVYF